MLVHINSLQEVVDWELCTGCGACYYACDRGAVRLEHIPSVGIRPRFESQGCASCTRCLSFCPGYAVDGQLQTEQTTVARTTENEFGFALEIWEGHAADAEIRHRASSGGVLSALALYCLEREAMRFVLHTAAHPDEPWSNQTVTSTTREDLLSRTAISAGVKIDQ